MSGSVVATEPTNNEATQTQQSTNRAQCKDAGLSQTDMGKRRKKYLAQIQAQIDNIKGDGQLDEAKMGSIVTLTENKFKLQLDFRINEQNKLTDQLKSMDTQLKSYHSDIHCAKRKFKQNNYKLHNKKKKHEQKGIEGELKNLLETKIWPRGLIVGEEQMLRIAPNSPATIIMDEMNIATCNLVRARWWETVITIVKAIWKKRRNNVSQKIKDICVQGK